MDLKTELKRAVIVCICLLLFFCSKTTALGTDTDAYITIEASTVANLYYEVMENGSLLDESMRFILKDAATGEVIAEGITENGILFIPNVPFGRYILEAENGRQFSLLIDTTYLKEAHVLKALDISIATDNNVPLDGMSDGESVPSTGDETVLHPIVFLFVAAAGILLLASRRKEGKTA